MALQIQPPEVQARNAKLIVVVIVLSLPFLFWAVTTDLSHAPRWLPMIAYLTNFAFVGTVVHFVRKRLIRNAHKKTMNDGA
jgi:hypothetical protein